MSNRREALVLLVLTVLGLVISGIGSYDPKTWVMEIFPIVIAAPILVLTARRFPLTPLAYRLIFIHAVILMIGGHYTYEKVPLGDWVKEWFGLHRNHYDRLGHFAQGFIPAIVAREILLRNLPLRAGGWVFFFVTCVCLAISACYEFIEWWTALIIGGSADAFLATQGDVWDTQTDMFLALIGAMVAQLAMARMHDRQIGALAIRKAP